jgi:hypothetical protein
MSGRNEAQRERVRARIASSIPWWYSPWGHLAATTGIGLAVLAVATARLARLDLRASDALVVPLVFLFSNFFEWYAHKRFLHRRTWPFEVVYDKHTPGHHMVYVEDDMALRSSNEMRLVLIPAMGVLGIVVTASPVAVLVGTVWSAAAGWLMLLTASLFMVSYELLHLAYHAPAESVASRLGLVRRLRAHHARHHDPRLMQRYNFNVTVPLFDWIMGTRAPERAVAGARDAPRQAP